MQVTEPPPLDSFFSAGHAVRPEDAAAYSTPAKVLEKASIAEEWVFEAARHREPPNICVRPYRAVKGWVKAKVIHRVLGAPHADAHQDCCNDYCRRRAGESLVADGYIVRRFCVETEDLHFDACLVGHAESIHSGNWVMVALPGHGDDLEHALVATVRWCHALGLNVLMINGPETGRSEGRRTWKALGDSCEAGLQFLEKTVQARKILMLREGLLGGPAMGRAILDHDFASQQEQGREYYCLSLHAIDKLSKASTVSRVWLRLFGVETRAPIDSSRRLSELGISEIVVNACDHSCPNGLLYVHTGDAIEHPEEEHPEEEHPEEEASASFLPGASLGHRLVGMGATARKIFMGHPVAFFAGTLEPDYWMGQMTKDLTDMLTRLAPAATSETLGHFLSAVEANLRELADDVEQEQDVEASLRMQLGDCLDVAGAAKSVVPRSLLESYINGAKHYLIALITDGVVAEWNAVGRPEDIHPFSARAWEHCLRLGFTEASPRLKMQDSSWPEFIDKMVHHRVFEYQIYDQVKDVMGLDEGAS
jgi:hypothetical protein